MKRKLVLLLTLFMMFPIFANGEQAGTDGRTMDDLYIFSSDDPFRIQKEIEFAVQLDDSIPYRTNYIYYNEETDHFIVLAEVDGYYSIACEAQSKKDDTGDVAVMGWVEFTEGCGVFAKRLYDSVSAVRPDSSVIVSIYEDGKPGVSANIYDIDLDTRVDLLLYMDGELIMDVAKISN